jgi:hypothetical protein
MDWQQLPKTNSTIYFQHGVQKKPTLISVALIFCTIQVFLGILQALALSLPLPPPSPVSAQDIAQILALFPETSLAKT